MEEQLNQVPPERSRLTGEAATADTEGNWREHKTAGVLIGAAAVAVVALVISINLLHTAPKASASGANGSMSSSSASMSGSSSASTATTSSTGGMTGMSMKGSTAMSSNGVMTIRQATLPAMQTSGKMPVAMAMVPLGQTNWDGMTIAARTSAPATFILLNGTAQQMVRPNSKSSFHLMVLLSDEYTQVAIPYSSIWATITRKGKVVFDERLWPMISRYMGPHYGNNVALPGSGVYQLTLLVSPPEAARHLEYNDLWLQPHRVSFEFRWIPKT
jgi:hypothetical protein